jgi:hypothetical protein
VNQTHVTAASYLLLTAFLASNFYAASLIADTKLRKRAKNIAALLLFATFGYIHLATYVSRLP